MTEQEREALPPLPEWTKRDDLGGLVPSEIRSAMVAYARAAQAATPAPAPQDAKEQCSYCRHPLFAATKCHSCGYEPVQAATPAPAPQPLTDEQIMGLAFKQRYVDGAQYLIEVARAIERAHGIKENKHD